MLRVTAIKEQLLSKGEDLRPRAVPRLHRCLGSPKDRTGWDRMGQDRTGQDRARLASQLHILLLPAIQHTLLQRGRSAHTLLIAAPRPSISGRGQHWTVLPGLCRDALRTT